MAVERDCILSRRGDITLAFKVRLPEIFTLSHEDYETFHQAWVRAIRALPSCTVFHKQDWFTRAHYHADFSKVERSALSLASERFFNERPFLDHDCYIMLTKRPSGRKPSSSLTSALVRGSIVPSEVHDERSWRELEESASQFASILQGSGFMSLSRLREREILSTGQSAGLLERYMTLADGHDGPRVADIAFDECICIGDQYARLYTLGCAENLPPCCGSRITYDKYSTDRTRFSIGFASSLGQLLPCNHLLSQYIFIEDPRKALQRLESRRLRLQSLSAWSRENALARDAVNDFLNEAVAEQRQPVKAHINLLVWTGKRSGIDELNKLVTAAFAQMDAVTKAEVLGAPQIFWAGIPGNEGDFPMNDSFDTFAEQAACFLNTETGYRSSLSPVGIRLGDRITGAPVHVDISDEPLYKGLCTNRNKFILGPSGSGKSFFTNHMLRSYYEQGAHIVVVDVGHSYRGLCELIKGVYFTYSEDSPIRFNPFYIGEQNLPDTERKESIKTLLLALWKRDDEQYHRSEYVALSNALQQYYAWLQGHPEQFPCFDSFYDFLKDDFGNALEEDGVREKDFDIRNFLYVLRPYYKGGEYDYLLNARKNIDLLNERFIVFELDNIKDHPILFPVVTIIIMDVFISKMRKLKGIRKIILIEEAWKAIAKEGMAEYIRYLFKTVRKHFGEAVVVTQEVEDIISSPIVKQTIINNSDCKILLDQSKYQNKFDQVQELLGLTEKEKALVLSVNRANEPGRRYKEVFISLGGAVSKVYRTEVSPEEYYTYTTEEMEKMKVLEYARSFGSMEAGIAMLVREDKTQSEAK